MRKLLFALGLITATLSQAQTEKGTLLPGGSISFQTSESGSQFNFTPSLGVFIKDNFAVGGTAFLVIFEDEVVYGGGPQLWKYFGKSPKGRFFLTAHGTVLTDSEGDDPLFNYGASTGYAFFLNRSVSLELGVQWNHYGVDYNILSFGTGFRMHLGRQPRREK